MNTAAVDDESTVAEQSISNPARLRPAIGGGMRSRHVIAALIAVAGISAALSAQSGQINGAGATFPNPIYSKWFSEYNKLHPTVQINYQPLGSGAGIR